MTGGDAPNVSLNCEQYTKLKMAETFKDIEDSEYCERSKDLVLDLCYTAS